MFCLHFEIKVGSTNLFLLDFINSKKVFCKQQYLNLEIILEMVLIFSETISIHIRGQ